ncbi:acyltransferase [Citricoccus muralis]|uniref:Succinyltransferase-like protein n=1 Tax=Citricoccus muralis TaxID=169134 RepID=A0A3D9L8S6_9MICC|nr:acyltransferase [Citricoccus muralis]REE02761.1 succinyltransferase-like protein [Citricoccus muralis]
MPEMIERTTSEDVAYSVAPGADVSADAVIGAGTKIWHLAQVREKALLGPNCVVGRGAYIGTGVTVGENCKIQNHALVYEPAQLADGVFIGPAVVLTNDTYPRAINPDGTQKSASDWDAVGVSIGRGAAIGARAVCVAPLTIGAWALVAAGSVVTRDVPDHALVAGVPARRLGWVGKTGRKLEPSATEPSVLVCPDTGEKYREDGDALVVLDGEEPRA